MAIDVALEQEMQYKSLVSHQLSLAYVSLREIGKLCDECAARNIQSALIRDAIVLYASAFMESRLGNGQVRRLQKRYVPRKFKKLHDRLMDYRSKSFAHFDLEFKKPRQITNQDELTYFSHAKGASDFTEDVPNMIALIGTVIATLSHEVMRDYQTLSQQHSQSAE